MIRKRQNCISHGIYIMTLTHALLKRKVTIEKLFNPSKSHVHSSNYDDGKSAEHISNQTNHIGVTEK